VNAAKDDFDLQDYLAELKIAVINCYSTMITGAKES